MEYILLALFLISIIFTIVLYVKIEGFTSENRQETCQERIDKLEIENDKLKTIIINLESQYKESLESEMLASREVSLLRNRIFELESRLEKMEKKSSSFKILGIWPRTNLGGINIEEIEKALYNSGIDYIPLTGEVTARDINQQLRWNKDITVLEIDTHGSPQAILLSDGEYPIGWWRRLIRDLNIKVAVLMACESEEIGRALHEEGVAEIVAVMNKIRDDQAIKFVVAFYESLASGLNVGDSVKYARLEVDYTQANYIVYIGDYDLDESKNY